jgi:ribosomal protein S18 acetylase RimI-like enzyme
MHQSGWQLYVDAFRDTSRTFAGPGQALIDEAGIVGVAGSEARHNGRLLLIDDSALPVLRTLVDPHARMVNVAPAAAGCMAYMSGLATYRAEDITAMVTRDLGAVPPFELDGPLTVRRARVDAVDGEVHLDRAAAACMQFDPVAADLTLHDFVSYLQSLPNAEFFVAVDQDGSVHATAGSSVVGKDARVFFVSTDPGWRGRGVGTAMTATALRAAHARGATRAGLDASRAGQAIYRRLGFDDVAQLTMFMNLA